MEPHARKECEQTNSLRLGVIRLFNWLIPLVHVFISYHRLMYIIDFSFLRSGRWVKGRCLPPLPALRTARPPTTDWARIDILHRAIRLHRRPARPPPSETSPTVCGGAKFTNATLKVARKCTRRARTWKLTSERTRVSLWFSSLHNSRLIDQVVTNFNQHRRHLQRFLFCRFFVFLFFIRPATRWVQVKSRTSVRGTVALGNLHGLTSWPAISASTRDKSRSVATCASVRSHDPTICHCTWSDTDVDRSRLLYILYFTQPSSATAYTHTHNTQQRSRQLTAFPLFDGRAVRGG